MPLFNRENKIKALYERMVGSRWQCIMILYQTEKALRIISRSQYWLAACKPSLCYTSLVLVTETLKKKTNPNIKKKILKHRGKVNLTAASILKVYFLVVVFTCQIFKLVSIFDCFQFADGSSACSIILGFTLPLSLPPLVPSGCSFFHYQNFWDSRLMFPI